jgi:hypothetical protein
MSYPLGVNANGLIAFASGFKLEVDIDVPSTGWLSFKAVDVGNGTQLRASVNGREVWTHAGDQTDTVTSPPIQLTEQERREKTLKLQIGVGEGQTFPSGGIRGFITYEEQPPKQ